MKVSSLFKLGGVTERRVLMMSWPVDAQALRPYVPAPLQVDTDANGKAWLTAEVLEVPSIRSGPVEAPTLGARQTNLRTPVRCHGEPGVYFISTGENRATHAWMDRMLFSLNASKARIDYTLDGDTAQFDVSTPQAHIAFAGRARIMPTAADVPADLRHFLFGRDTMFGVSANGVSSTTVHHPEWKLQPAQIALDHFELLDPVLKPSTGAPSLCVFAQQNDADVVDHHQVSG